jgi:hypothetical protein
MKTELTAGIVSLALAAGGCATPQSQEIAPGHVALAHVQYAPDADFNAYASGRAANSLKDGGRGAGRGIAIGSMPLQLGRAGPIGMVIGAVIAVPLMAVGAVVGGTAGLIHGAATGLPSEQVDAIHEPVARMRGENKVQADVAQRVLVLSGERRHHTVTYLPEAGTLFRQEVEVAYERLAQQAVWLLSHAEPQRTAQQAAP